MNKLKKITTFFLLSTFVLTLSARAQSQNVISGEKGKKIDEVMSSYHREGLLNGTILVAERGKIIYQRGFGFANMEFKVPNAPDTKFRIASISKPIVAVLAMRLIEQGKLSLDAKVSDFLPDYRKDIADKVTVRHLLSHTSGIPDTLVPLGLWDREIRDPVTPQELLARYSVGALEFEPGTRFKYSTIAYALLSLMIEKATGKSFEQALRDEVFAPAGMKDAGMEGGRPIVIRSEQGRTALKGGASVIERLATGYFKTADGFGQTPFMDMTHPGAGGSMYATVEDLFRLDRALTDDKFLSKQIREVMFTPILEDMSLGWNVRHLLFADLQQPFLNIVDPPTNLRPAPADFKVVYKLGDVWGFSGVFARFPNEGHAIAILVNRNNRGLYFDLDTIRMWQAITNILYEKPYFTPRERMFAEVIEREGFEKALQTFKRLKQTEANSPIISESEFNTLGYEILRQKKFAQAIGVFKLNVEAHPNSANTYDSLADAYEQSGEKKNAIKFYEKVLEMLPNDKNINETVRNNLRTNAERKLKELKGNSN